MFKQYRLLFIRFVKYNIIVNILKLLLFILGSTFLSFNIFCKSIKADLAKVVAIKDCLELIIITKIYVFINAAKYFRYLISNYLFVIELFIKAFTGALKNIPIKLDYVAKGA